MTWRKKLFAMGIRSQLFFICERQNRYFKLKLGFLLLLIAIADCTKIRISIFFFRYDNDAVEDDDALFDQMMQEVQVTN